MNLLIILFVMQNTKTAKVAIRKYTPEFKTFVIKIFSKFALSGFGHARSTICKLFDIPASTLSSWVTKSLPRLSTAVRRGDRHGGWVSPFMAVNVVPATVESRSLTRTVVTTKPKFNSDAGASFGLRARAVRMVTVASQMEAPQETVKHTERGCVSLLQRASGTNLRPFLGLGVENQFLKRFRCLQLPRSLSDAAEIHCSRHSAVYIWQWGVLSSLDDFVLGHFVIKVFKDRLAYLNEKAAFAEISRGFTNGAIAVELTSLFCFPVVEYSCQLPSAGVLPSSTFVFEHFPLMSLSEVRSCIQQNFDRAWQLLNQLMIALSAVHAAGLVHCDVKPGNVLVRVVVGSLELKLIDFSCAHPLGSSGSRAGTGGYRALEVLSDSRRFLWSSSQDIYSCAVTVCSFVAGRNIIDIPDRSTVAEREAVRTFCSSPEQHLLQFSAFVYWREIDAPEFQRFCSVVSRMVNVPRASVREIRELCVGRGN